ncbi:MAG: ABC transporter substrate-binding protein, partial [Propionibacteriaceae bacterium]|nr:ABC transporter substrate-binding protein [Propionibacteriaceae bacterium]
MDYRGLVRGPRRVLAAVLAGCLMLVATACSPSDPTPSLRTLTVGATLEPPAMDPFQNTAASIPQVLLYNVYETLLKVNSEGHLTPLLAQKWVVSQDRKTYTFHLNPAAKFASGAPVDAEAVKANIDRMRTDPKLTETLRAQLEVVESVEAPEPARVVITLSRPSLLWLYEMSSTLGMIVDPSFTGDLATTTAGSGPYQLQTHNRGQSVVLSRNEEYWGTPGRFDQVTFRYYSDPNAMNASMLAGDLDIISNLQAPDALPQFADTSRFTTIS